MPASSRWDLIKRLKG